MKAYSITLLVIDHDNIGKNEIEYALEETKYPNRCISPLIIHTIETDIGKWSDDHPLNNRYTLKEEFNRLFPPVKR